MCVLSYEGGSLKEILRERKIRIYDNITDSFPQLVAYCMDVAKGMNYLSHLEVAMCIMFVFIFTETVYKTENVKWHSPNVACMS